jgi:predicted Zn finger-like uncharacterized protein
MSLITCCPSCGTMFRVVPDQLKISEGWVRCGHCAEVFDATAHMMDEAPADVAEASITQPAPTEPPPDSRSLQESELDRPFVFRRSDLGDLDDAPSVSPPVAPPAPRTAAARNTREGPPSSGFGPEAPLEDLSFIRQARRKAFWGRPMVRRLLVVALLGLVALLALQIGVHDRDRLAAAEPSLRPWLQRLCEPFSCSVGPPRQIEAVAIDGSSFNRLRGDAYRLNITLRNQALVEVAVPSIELTLTDTQDQPVLRRVLTPDELGAATPVLGANSEWSATVSMAVAGNGSGGRIAGYRLLAFYP